MFPGLPPILWRRGPSWLPVVGDVFQSESGSGKQGGPTVVLYGLGDHRLLGRKLRDVAPAPNITVYSDS